MKRFLLICFVLSALHSVAQKRSVSLWIEPKYTAHSHYNNYYIQSFGGIYCRKESGTINFAAGLSKQIKLKNTFFLSTGLQLDNKGFKYEANEILPADGTRFVKRQQPLWFLGLSLQFEHSLSAGKGFFISGGIVPELSVWDKDNNYNNFLLSSNFSAGYKFDFNKTEAFIKGSYRYTFTDLYRNNVNFPERHIQSAGIAFGVNLF